MYSLRFGSIQLKWYQVTRWTSNLLGILFSDY